MKPDERTPRGTLVTDDVDAAAALLRAGALVAFPTETVYGLGARADDAAAVARIFVAKGRPADNPVIVHAADRAGLAAVVGAWPAAAEALAALWPAPLTLVVPRAAGVPDVVTAGRGSVGVRVPDHARARALLAAAGVPIAAPSANVSGRPSATRAEDVLADLDGRVACVLRDVPGARVGLESTVVDTTSDPPCILRPGAIALAALRARVGRLVARPPDGDDAAAARSPGTRHPHYAPRARVRIVDGPSPARDTAWIGVTTPPPGYTRVVVVADVVAYAAALYATFRDVDAAGLAAIDCERVPEDGLGVALMDRLRRAADAQT